MSLSNLASLYEGQRLTRREAGFSKHHFDPISLGGHDLQHNIHTIINKAHDHIHNTLNIPLSLYSAKTREWKKSCNHKLITTIESINQKYELQGYYFKKLYMLEDEIIELHKQVKFRGVQYREQIAKNFIEVNNMQSKENFYLMQEHIKNIEISICQEISKTLNKKFYHNK